MQDSAGRRFVKYVSDMALGRLDRQTDLRAEEAAIHQAFDIHPPAALKKVRQAVEQGRFDGREFVGDIRGLLRDEHQHPWVLEGSLKTLRTIGDPATPAIAEAGALCQHHSPFVRQQAYSTVEELGKRIMNNDQQYLFGALGEAIPKLALHLPQALDAVVELGFLALKKHVDSVTGPLIESAMPEIHKLSHNPDIKSHTRDIAEINERQIQKAMLNNGYGALKPTSPTGPR